MTASGEDPARSALWTTMARRIVEGVGARAGDLVLVRGGGDGAVLEDILLALEEVGATPLPEIVHPAYLRRLLQRTDPAYLEHWDRHRSDWIRRAGAIVTLASLPPHFSDVPPAALEAWEGAVARLTAIAVERKIPKLVVAVPDGARAASLGMTVRALEDVLLPALAVSSEELRTEIDRLLPLLFGTDVIIVQTGTSCELRLLRGNRRWLGDDGVIDESDRAADAGVSNLPAGSIYTTVIEDTAEGTLWLPQAGPAEDVTLRFERGRIVDIAARVGAAQLAALFDRHSGESRRISHIGIGLNPRLHHPIGWVLVDEHIHGALFVAFGENRYMGGANASSLNVDFCVSNPTILADGRSIVREGVVVTA